MYQTTLKRKSKLIPRRRVPPEKLAVSQVVKKFPSFYGT
jgi:hypothetical protein